MLRQSYAVAAVFVFFAAFPSMAGAKTSQYFNINSYTNYIKNRADFGGQIVPIATGYDVDYPSSGQFANMLILISTASNTSRLIMVQDPNPSSMVRWYVFYADGSTPSPCVNGQLCLEVGFYDDNAKTISDTTYQSSDWRVPAAAYRDYIKQQSFYRSHGKLIGTNLKHIMSCSNTSYNYYNTTQSPLVDEINGISGCFIPNYRSSNFDENYPDYTCSVSANCAAYLKKLHDTNVIPLPYINGVLWDTTNQDYSDSKMCLDASGDPYEYPASTMRYADNYQEEVRGVLRSEFDSNLVATGGQISNGVYLDVLAASVKACYVAGVPSYSRYIAGTKSVFEEFDDKIIMSEMVTEPYIQYVDITYNYTSSQFPSSAINLYQFLYGEIPGFFIAGGRTSGSETNTQLSAVISQWVGDCFGNVTLFNSYENDTSLLGASFINALNSINQGRIAPCGYAMEPKKRARR